MPYAIDYRPQTLEQVMGNATTVAALRGVLGGDALPPALLFTGPSGCGKTTLARIVATHLKVGEWDFTELNTASFRGIESAREIIRRMELNPMGGDRRIWFMDECHQITRDAQEALLKAMENPPPHVLFMFATTDPDKLRRTFRNRCMEFSVAELTEGHLLRLLKRVRRAEALEVPPEVLERIAAESLGCPRVALVTLEKIAALEPADMEEAIARQIAEQNESIELCRALVKGVAWRTVAGILRGLTADPETVRRAVLGYGNAILTKKDEPRVFLVMDAFREPFYNTGRPGLTMACYEVVSGGGA